MFCFLRRILQNHPFHFTLLAVSFPVIILAATLFAPTVEHGVFAVSLVFALLIFLFSTYIREPKGKGVQLAVCCMLTTCFIFVTASLLDIVDFSMPGKEVEGITLLLTGVGFLLFVVTALFFWMNWRFLTQRIWWFVAAAVLWFLQSDVVNQIWVELPELNPLKLPFICLAGFFLIARYKQRFSDRSFLILLLITITALMCAIPPTEGKLILSLLGDALFFLFGLYYLLDRWNGAPAGRILAVFICLIGASELSNDLLHKGLGINEMVAGFPGLFSFMLGLVWLWLQRSKAGRFLLGIAVLTYYICGLYYILPDEYASVALLLCLLIVFILTVLWNMPATAPIVEVLWKQRLQAAAAAGGVLLLMIVNSCLVAVILLMLTANIGPARLLASFHGTAIWPGDRLYAAIALKDEYFWKGEANLPALAIKENDIDGYITKALPTRDRYSFVTTAAEEKDRSAGFVTSCGFDYRNGKESLSVLTVNHGTSAWKSGLQRGDRIVAVNGKPVGSTVHKNHDKTGKTAKGLKMQVLTTDGKTREMNISIDRHESAPSFSRIIKTTAGTKIGYLYFSDFDLWQEQQMADIFRSFSDAKISDLVLDLRYNGGGRVAIAQSLAGYLAGTRHKGKPFFADRHNSRYRDRDEEVVIPEKENSLDLRRLVVLTTGETASASEAIISGLKPYMKVVTVGEPTYGKPFFMTPIKCGSVVLELINGIGSNANGETVPESGIRPDYLVKDDLKHQLGDSREALLKKALEILGDFSLKTY